MELRESDWGEIFTVSGYKIDAMTRVLTYVCLNTVYGHCFEITDDDDGFADFVAEVTRRLPGLSPDWFLKIVAMKLGDEPIEVWRRA